MQFVREPGPTTVHNMVVANFAISTERKLLYILMNNTIVSNTSISFSDG